MHLVLLGGCAGGDCLEDGYVTGMFLSGQLFFMVQFYWAVND
jgi:hypothetical protein